jgi:hypothetical protein
LKAYIDHANGAADEGWIDNNPSVIYQKHITSTHFTWIKYDTEINQLLGMGGGTYMINDDGKYVENIDFFYPPGSSELGQAIPFDVSFDKEQWFHTGYAKTMSINEQGEIIPTDSVKIEEIWSPLIAEFDNKKDIMGTWVLSKYRDETTTPYMEYPNFQGYMKLITPSHFTWIQYDKEGDEIFAAGSGTYSYNGKKYKEHLLATYPSSSPIQDKLYEFEINLSDHRWEHFGHVDPLDDADDMELIDEVWIPYQPNIEDETAFYD